MIFCNEACNCMISKSFEIHWNCSSTKHNYLITLHMKYRGLIKDVNILILFGGKLGFFSSMIPSVGTNIEIRKKEKKISKKAVT